MSKSKHILLLFIILIAAFLRLNSLSSVPPHPSLDEVSIGYNAYSILKTGADEYGEKFPILLRAYDDWRPALYVYLVVPFVKLIGLNIFAVRIPSIALSILTVAATYFLTKELLKTNRKSNPALMQKDLQQMPNSRQLRREEMIALFSSFLLAVSPWHVYFSRIGHEWNGALSFFIFGLLFFFKYINSFHKASHAFFNGNFNFILTSICFALSFDFYQSAKVFIPIFAFALFLLFRKEIMLRKKIFLVSLIAGFLVILPILIESLSPYALVRLQGTNLFEARKDLFDRSASRLLYDINTNNLPGFVFDNRRLLYFLILIQAYFSHFNLAWLFTNSGEEVFKVPDFGLFYLFELPLILSGIVYLVKRNGIALRVKLIVLLWILTAILPASISTGYPHASRIYNILPAPQMVGALGFYFLWNGRGMKKLLGAGVLGVVLFFVLWFSHAYFVNFRRELSYQFQYGVTQALSYANSVSHQYDKVVVSNQTNLFQSYMFYLFMKKFNPIEYQRVGGTVSGGFDASHKIGRFEFGKVSNADPRGRDNNILYVINPNELPEGKMRIINRVKFLDGRDAIWIVEGK